MKLRKLFTATLSILLIVALTGCGGSKSEAGTTPDKTSETDASELMNLYDSISADTKYVALSDLPEITAKESYTIGVAMTDVSTGWFKALYAIGGQASSRRPYRSNPHGQTTRF